MTHVEQQITSEKATMYHHVKKLRYTVHVDSPDPAFGNMLMEQFGGANGEVDARGPGNEGNGWKFVESPAFTDGVGAATNGAGKPARRSVKKKEESLNRQM